jgi:hypothetical protein
MIENEMVGRTRAQDSGLVIQLSVLAIILIGVGLGLMMFG